MSMTALGLHFIDLCLCLIISWALHRRRRTFAILDQLRVKLTWYIMCQSETTEGVLLCRIPLFDLSIHGV